MKICVAISAFTVQNFVVSFFCR